MGRRLSLAAPLWEQFGRKEVVEKCEGIFMASVRGFDRNADLKRETRPGDLEDTEKACKNEVMGPLFWTAV